MIISESRKFIFLKIARTASTSIQLALEKFCVHNDWVTRQGVKATEQPFNAINTVPHVQMSTIVRAYFNNEEDRLGDYFKFCFVRNPFTRMLSKFWGSPRILEKVMPEPWDIATARHTFSAFVMETPMAPCLRAMSHKGKQRMDFVGRFENLLADYEKICTLINIPCEPLPRAQVHKKLSCHYSEMYTPTARKRVEKMARDDLEAFGYEFEKP